MGTDAEHHEATAERDRRLAELRYPGGPTEFVAPAIEPLASRLERATRVNLCHDETDELMRGLEQRGWGILQDVWVKGVCVHFFVAGWKGIFLVWSIDQRWTTDQAAMVMPVRDQIQRELGPDFTGQVEAVFHSPHEHTGWDRRVLVDPQTGKPIDIVIIGGRVDLVIDTWKPIGGVGLDPEWVRSLSEASKPRWWRSREGELPKPPPPPPEERL